jgi:hypothetical protein
MATFTKQKLSGSTNGKQILITATTNGAAQTIHTAVAGTSSFDEIWLYAFNDSANIVNLALLWGGTTEPDNLILIPVPSQAGRVCVVDGMLLQNGLLVKAYAVAGSVIVVDGFVNNIA